MIVRQATADDADQMSDLLNEIIEIGGTTAHRRRFDPERMIAHYIINPLSICCHVAVDGDEVLGFQSLAWADPGHKGDFVLPADWAVIATFARVGRTGNGIGGLLFGKTVEAARGAGVTAIDATIRTENTGGQRYYDRMGFETYRQAVETVSKRFPIKT